MIRFPHWRYTQVVPKVRLAAEEAAAAVEVEVEVEVACKERWKNSPSRPHHSQSCWN